MPKSALQKLYDGEIFPSEQIIPRTPRYKHVITTLEDAKKQLKLTLNDNGKGLFNRIETLTSELDTMYGYEEFAYGFRLAVALMLDRSEADSFDLENKE
jgi:uncharacterized protein YgfB (UPF0149 family)